MMRFQRAVGVFLLLPFAAAAQTAPAKKPAVTKKTAEDILEMSNCFMV